MTLIGKTLGKYRVIKHSGSGGMAEVYKAYQPGLDRYVAIKVLHSFLANEEDFLTRFQREARIVATFRHPNIVQVYDFELDVGGNLYYMVMEFVDGPSLKARLQEMTQEGQRLPLEEAVRVVVAIANALDYAHQHGMVHRDVKPANILFTQDGQVVLTDFGIARMINTTTLTASGAMVGTPAYMAPEQGMGKAGNERADIYSLGAVLYQLVTGSLPFNADTPLGIILKHINAPLTPPTTLNANLPAGIETVTMRALAKDPNNRHQTAREFAADLERGLAGEPVESISPEPVIAPPAFETTVIPYAQGQARQWEQLIVPSPSASPPPLATPLPQAVPVARPRWRRVAVLAAVLALALLGSAALLNTGIPRQLFVALFSQATPTPGVTGTPTPTLTPDLTATYNVNAAQFAAWMATYEATTGITFTPSPTPTPTPTSTPTPDLTATAVAACVFDMEVVNDRSVWPRILTPRQQFVKHWKIKNTGTCAWPEDVQLTFVSGDELQVVEGPEVESLSPEETAEIDITLRAPVYYSTYTSAWQLQDGEGDPIGEELEITCRVGPTPTPRLTATPTATSTPEFTLMPTEPLWMSIPGLAWCSGTRTSGRIEWGRGGGPNEEYRYFSGSVSPASELPGPYNKVSGFPHVMTYFTTSGTLVWPIPDDCCLGDYGRYVSPEGYEIVWKKVWHSEESCP